MANPVGRAGKVKVVALDFDGVITNLDIDWHDALRHASAVAGYKVKSLNLFYAAEEGKPVFQKVSDEIEKLEMQALEKAQLTPFAEEFLRKICESHIDMYVVSMQSALVVETFLRREGLTGYFSEIVTRERCPSKKAQVAHVLKETGIRPEELLLVDDSKKNITNCQPLGIKCFHFARQQSPSKIREMWTAILDLLNGEPSRTKPATFDS
jgi:HAD superfamily hydrolase (TIGR01509 family)